MTRSALRPAITCLLLLLVLGGAPILWSAERPLLPGLAGCGTVRHAEPRTDCYARYVLERADTDRGLRAALADLEQARTDRTFTSECHQATHDVGKQFARSGRAPDAVARVIGSLESRCAPGVTHGLVEYSVEQDATAFARIVNSVCPRSGTARGIQDCFHGIGHGLYQRAGAEAADRCAAIPGGVDRGDCLLGYYMEAAMDRYDATKRAAPESHCADVPADHVFQCHAYVPHVELTWGQVDSTVAGARAFCEQLEAGSTARRGCVARISGFGKPALASARGCAAGDDVLAAVCTWSIARDHVDAPVTAGAIERRCPQLPSPFGCAAGLGAQLAWTSAKPVDALLSTCEAVADDALAAACEGGLRGCWPAPPGGSRPGGCDALVPARMRIA